MQLFAASPTRDSQRLEYPLSPPGWVPEARDGLLTEPWLQHGGELTVPDRPGLGFEIDRLALRKYGSRFFVATPARVALRAVRERGLSEARHLGKIRSNRLSNRQKQLEAQIGAGEDPTLGALRDLAPGDAK
jgi:D-galactarolactone cycloisomerase